MGKQAKGAALTACWSAEAWCWDFLPAGASTDVLAAAGWAALSGLGLLGACSLFVWRAKRASARATGALAAQRRAADCLCAVFEATAQPARPLAAVLADVVSLLPSGCAAAAEIAVRVDLDGETCASPAGGAPGVVRESPILVDGRLRGGLRVSRRGDGSAFCEAETVLFERVARRLAGMLRERDVGARQPLRAEIATQVVDAAKVVLLIVGNDARVRYLNDCGEALLGYRRGEIIGRDWFDLMLNHEADGYSRKAFEAAVAAGEPASEFENTVVTRGGEPLRIEWRNSKLDAGNGDWHWLCVGRDVTALRAAEHGLAAQQAALEAQVAARTAELERTTRALRALNAEQHAILQTAPAGIVVTRERRILRCNRALEEMLGYAAGELLGRETRVWYQDDASFEAIQRRFETAMHETGLWREELEIQRKDGSRFRCRFFGRWIDLHDPTGGEVVVLDDVSAEYARRLELEQSRAAAEAAAQVKSEFLANMSHELRTPLNALLGFTGLLLRQGGQDARSRAWLEKMESAGLYLSRLVSDILDFSRLEAGRLALERVDFRLGQVLRSAVGMVAEPAREKGLELVVDVEPGVPSSLTGDPTRLAQVLVNLLGNAVKFSDEGEVVLRVGLLDRDSGHVTLRFEVRDRGIGLGAEEQARVFGRFEQVDASLTRRHGGAGLGLAIARELTQLMNGEIGVDSAPGQGARFWFTAAFGCSAAAASPWEMPADLRRAKVLVAVANAEARAAIGRMLESMGLDVHAADSRADCARKLTAADAAGAPYVLCFADAALPATPAHRPKLVALVDGPADTPGAVPADEVLTRPLTPSALFNAAMNALRGDAAVPVLRLPLTSRAEARFAGRRVLLVEDHEANRDLMINLLAEYGLWTDLAENGAVALRRLATQRYDLVFMDLQMPVMGGLEATRLLRKQRGVPQPTVIAVTAHAMDGDRERCFEAGMNDYLTKPVSPDALDAQLRRWLGGELAAGARQGHGTLD